jgi:ribosome-binding factor A
MSERYSRSDRVSEAIRRELAQLIATELKDPRVGMVSLTEVEITPDYAHAKVFYTTMAEGEALQHIQDGLARASGFLRRELGRRVRIHTTPALHFVHDETLARADHLSRLIDKALNAGSSSTDGD